MGIRTEWVDAMTFGLGSVLPGCGRGTEPMTNVGPNLGSPISSIPSWWSFSAASEIYGAHS